MAELRTVATVNSPRSLALSLSFSRAVSAAWSVVAGTPAFLVAAA